MDPLTWQCGERALKCDRPIVMGVLNVTPDSFSDGGSYVDCDTAVAAALKLVDDGADVIDVGGESTRPGAEPVSIEEEIRRTAPVIEALRSRSEVVISIDTMKPEVAAPALAAGADVINDVTGFAKDEMIAVAAESGCGCVTMHMRGTPQTMQQMTDYDDVVAEVIDCCRRSAGRMLTGGIAESAIAVDPGIGFGKTVEQNLLLIRRLDELAALGYPVLLGTSRKSFIGKVLELDDPGARIWGTASSNALGVANGATIFRVHDVAEMRQVVDLAWAIARAE